MRGGNLAGLTIATVCGIATAYTTLQPALQEEAEKKAGTFVQQHEGEGDVGDVAAVNGGRSREKDTQLSRAILRDLKEAKREVVGEDAGKGGFAWGIRRWFSSSSSSSSSVETERIQKKDEGDAARAMAKAKE